MIVYFPPPYSDELVYSWLARYYAHSGHVAYTFAAQDLYVNPHTKPNIEFVNRLTEDASTKIEHFVSRTELMEKHTMFPFYSRFLDKERRNKAFNSLCNAEDGYCNLLCLPKNKQRIERFLRYCPMCSAEDRREYGETYWHRTHQMSGINLCSKHGCVLENTDVAIDSKGSPCLVTAEECISQQCTPVSVADGIETDIAKYVTSVFLQPLDMQNNIPVGVFLHSRMEGTEYLSLRGEKRNMQRLFDSFQRKYHSISASRGLEMWQMQKIFSGNRRNPIEICMIAFLLEVSPFDLTHMTLPEQSQIQRFDEQVMDLHKQGLKYPEIAKRLNASYDLVKPIGEGLYGKYHYQKSEPKKGGAKKFDWAKIDADTLPEVQRILSDLESSPNDKPVRISIGGIEKILGWPKKRLRQCPLCIEAVEAHMETQEEYWRRLVKWAVDRLIAEGKPVNITGVMRITNMRKRDFERIGIDFTNKNTVL